MSGAGTSLTGTSSPGSAASSVTSGAVRRLGRAMSERETPRYRETLWRLLGFLRPYKLTLALSLGLAVVAQICALSFPWLTGEVVAVSSQHP